MDHLFTTRRDFLTGGLALLSACDTLPVFLNTTVRALAGPEPTSKPTMPERILVVVQLAGGNDGLNMVIPAEMDAYYKSRPRLAIAKKDALPLKGGFGLHPAAVGLKELFDDGKLAIVHGVGYPNPNRSHFTSMDIWHTADPALRRQSGWLGRYFDACCKGADPDPGQGVALMEQSPLALLGERFSPLAFENPEALNWRRGDRDEAAQAAFEKLNNIQGDLPLSEDRTQQFLQRAALKALVGADQIRSAAKGVTGGRGRGGEFGRALALVTRMIAADLPTRIYYVSMGGFDTHTGQEGRHRRLMQELGEGLKDFVDGLRQQNLLDRVLILTFSEFGRRVQENASGGTDHGEAAPVLLLGSKVKPGLHEKHPDLAKLNRGDLAFSCDFRRVYAGVLRDWLQASPAEILGKSYSPLSLITK